MEKYYELSVHDRSTGYSETYKDEWTAKNAAHEAYLNSYGIDIVELYEVRKYKNGKIERIPLMG